MPDDFPNAGTDRRPDELARNLGGEDAVTASKHRADRSETRADRSEVRADLSEVRADRSETRADQSETRANIAHAKATANRHMIDIQFLLLLVALVFVGIVGFVAWDARKSADRADAAAAQVEVASAARSEANRDILTRIEREAAARTEEACWRSRLRIRDQERDIRNTKEFLRRATAEKPTTVFTKFVREIDLPQIKSGVRKARKGLPDVCRP